LKVRKVTLAELIFFFILTAVCNDINQTKSMGKERKESVAPEAEEGADDGKEISWEELVNRIGPFASPLASRKLTKRIYKVIKKGTLSDISSLSTFSLLICIT
jgi:hypothetical protein